MLNARTPWRRYLQIVLVVMVALNVQVARGQLAGGERGGGGAAPGAATEKPYGVEVIWPTATGEIVSLADVTPGPDVPSAQNLERDENTRIIKTLIAPLEYGPDEALQRLVGPNAPMPNPIANFDGFRGLPTKAVLSRRPIPTAISATTPARANAIISSGSTLLTKRGM